MAYIKNPIHWDEPVPEEKPEETPKPKPSGGSALTIGATGSQVEKLQKALQEKGYDLGNTGADSIFGEKTAAAVRQYQLDNGLLVDGIAGSQTLSHLYGSTQTPSVTPEPDPVIPPQKPQYAGTYDQQLQELYQKVVNRPDFTYNINEDALFAQYRDGYTQAGRLAMEDTMGKAAALTGGYGSSYAQAAGQQAYQSHLQKLFDTVPELEQRAYDRYAQAGEDLLDQYSLTLEQAEQEYKRYQDALSQYQKDTDAAYSRLQQLITTTGYTPTGQELADADMTQAQAQAYLDAYTAKNTPKYTYGGSTKKEEADPVEPEEEAPYVDLKSLDLNGYSGLQDHLLDTYLKFGEERLHTLLSNWIAMGYINEPAAVTMQQWVRQTAQQIFAATDAMKQQVKETAMDKLRSWLIAILSAGNSQNP